MRIAFVLDRYRPGKGGLERWVAALADHLAAGGHELHLVSGDREAPDGPFRHHRIRPRALSRAGRDRSFAERARALTAAADFDVVVGLRHVLACDVYAPHGGSVAAAFAAHRRARRGPALPSPRLRNFLRLERALLAGPTPPRAVLAVSESVRDDLAERYPPVADRVRVVPNGVDLDRFTPGPGSGRRAGVLLFVAGNPRLKGFREAARVFERLRAAGRAGELLVAGGDPGRLPAGGRYLGTVDRPEELYRGADLLLQPTHYDPFPLSTLEALACGTPVVTTRANGAVAHVGGDGPVAVAPAAEDVEEMAEHAARLLEERPREAARERAERFPLSTCLARAAELLTG